jgi:hypothetical protein
MAIARRGPASAGVLVAIDSLKAAQREGSLSVLLEKVEYGIDVLNGIPEGAHATTRLLLLQKQLQGMSSD